jgi:hypothetical protein
MEALREMAATRASVRRGGEVLDVSAADLVPGDIVLLEAGRVVPPTCASSKAPSCVSPRPLSPASRRLSRSGSRRFRA